MADPLLFQKTLQDLIKGIRSHKKDPSAFVSKSIAEIKEELRSNDGFLKAEAIRKLTYLQMIGYNVSWAAFSIVEVMSQARLAHKRIGYLAANQTFDDSTDVILLTTNLFKKEFASSTNQNQYEVGMAINCLANIATKELARDCISDLVTLMNHSKPYIRKKAILAMYKLYIKFPQGLRLTFDKLKDRLDDSESSVVSTAVNVICELANKNPKNFLAMAPKFFKLLTTSANNWMLIKVVKLLGSLVTEEPRLARKLLEPLATIIQNTGAKSLQYECIFTITEALPYSRREDGSEAKNAASVIALCSQYLRGFIEDADQNLKYLGLVGLCSLMRSSVRSIVDHRDLVLGCLNDDDVTIRSKALELLAGIASKKSLVDLVHHLLDHARRSEGSYRDEIIAKILWMCQKDKYQLVSDFAWYVSVLLELAVMPSGSAAAGDAANNNTNTVNSHSNNANTNNSSNSNSNSSSSSGQQFSGNRHGSEVADQLMEISLRVESVRAFAVDQLLAMLLNEALSVGHAKGTVVEVLRAAAWVTCEYAEVLSSIANDVAPDDEEDDSDSDDDDSDDSDSRSSNSDNSDDSDNSSGKRHKKNTKRNNNKSKSSKKDTAFWIEGATGEETRSLWRGQPLHYLVLKTLLSARSQTLLPPRVQIVYLQAAMKLFAHATQPSSGVSQSLLADLVGLMRTGLGRFAQHMDLEVQERATTLRHLLAALRVVPLDWEAQYRHTTHTSSSTSTSATANDATNNNNNQTLLLDLMSSMMQPVYDATSIRSLDETGAQQARQQQHDVFRALIHETFYAVHYKAQRKVPLPTDLRLDEAFNASAVAKLAKAALPEDLSLNNLCFVREKEPLPNHPSYANTNNHHNHNSNSNSSSGAGGGVTDTRLGVALDDIFSAPQNNLASQTSFQNNNNSNNSNNASSNSRDEVFLLQQRGNNNNNNNNNNNANSTTTSKLSQELVPLSKLLGAFEEISSSDKTRKNKSNKKGKHKDKKHSKRDKDYDDDNSQDSHHHHTGSASNHHHNTYRHSAEVLPAGAHSDDSDDDHNKNNHNNHNNNHNHNVLDEDDMNLAAIDITKPLQADEVLPTHAHRVVPDQSSSSTTHNTTSAAENTQKAHKKSKKDKKDKDKEKSGSKKHGDYGKNTAEDDLLGLDFPAPADWPLSSITTTTTTSTTSHIDNTNTNNSNSGTSSSKHKKHDKHSKDKKANNGTSESTTGDLLLLLDTNTTATTAASTTSPAADLLQLNHTTDHSQKNIDIMALMSNSNGNSNGNNSSSGFKNNKNDITTTTNNAPMTSIPEEEEEVLEGVWQVLHRSSHCLVQYLAVSAASPAVTDTLNIYFSVENTSHSNVVLSQVEVELQPHSLIRLIHTHHNNNNNHSHSHSHNRRLEVARHMTPGVSQRVATPITVSLVSPTALWEAGVIQTTCILHLSYTAGGGSHNSTNSNNMSGSLQEALHLSVPLRLCAATVSLTPYELSSSAFADKLAKASSKWAKRSLTLSLSSLSPSVSLSLNGKSTKVKGKDLFPHIARLLNAHSVETESSKAATFACRAPDGTRVFVLCKAGSEAVSVDVKCLGGSERESQAAVHAVCVALDLLQTAEETSF